MRSEAEKALLKKQKKKRAKKKSDAARAKKRSKPKGRPKGSRNKDKNQFTPSPEMLRIGGLLENLLKLIRRFVVVKYLALDGHFGHQQAVLMARLNGLELIGKMRRDAALWEKYDGKYKGKGRKTVYGKKLDYENIAQKCWKKGEREGELITNYYQAIVLHKEFGCELNVVIIERINLKSKQIGHANLFSSDVELSLEKMVDYYSLRFQIEFNFRDAKQHFGLEDFMNRGGKRSGKRGKYGIFDGQYEREIDKKQRRKMCRGAGLKNALSRSQIRSRSNKNTSGKSRNDYKERGNRRSQGKNQPIREYSSENSGCFYCLIGKSIVIRHKINDFLQVNLECKMNNL